MIDDIEKIAVEITQYDISTVANLENFRIHYLGSKGIIKSLYSALKDVPNEKKREVGQQINTLKDKIEIKFNNQKEIFENLEESHTIIDLSRPPVRDILYLW